MSRLFSILAVLLFALSISLAGCKKDDAASDKGSQSESLTKAETLKEKACACEDSACAQKVMKELQELGGAHAVKSQDEAKKLQDTVKEATTCLTKAMSK